jgi:putative FmdB family regulatory protein
MPIYDFKCTRCGTVSDIFVRDDNLDSVRCPNCGSSDIKKLFSSISLLRSNPAPKGMTCCGREERCEGPPCSGGEECGRR